MKLVSVGRLVAATLIMVFLAASGGVAHADAGEPPGRMICITHWVNGVPYVECFTLMVASGSSDDDCPICERYLDVQSYPSLPSERAGELVHHVAAGLRLLVAGSQQKALEEFRAAALAADSAPLDVPEVGEIVGKKFVATGDVALTLGGQQLVAGLAEVLSNSQGAMQHFLAALDSLAGK